MFSCFVYICGRKMLRRDCSTPHPTKTRSFSRVEDGVEVAHPEKLARAEHERFRRGVPLAEKESEKLCGILKCSG
jgi:hypothetical protein